MQQTFDIDSSKSNPQLNEITAPALCDDQLISEIQSTPNKMAFKIGEVGDMVGVKQYVLRYWESEFDALRPKKSKNGQRIYTKKDVETVFFIKKLLYRDRYSIEGAKSALRGLRDEFKRERDWKLATGAYQKARNEVADLANDIHRLRRLFE